VVLDGWDEGEVRHNIVNGLRWGPDGWLYGRHGIQATSRVGPPGAPPAQRVSLNCCVWRYHPTRKVFEVVCRGTTNPWGMDWNERGELFFINTVINHLWHALPGAHYQRMYGEDDNPRLYELMTQTADHFHWDTADAWHKIRQTGVTPTTDAAGGGHAHTGLLFYLGENWPERYRDTLFTINLHGMRLNNDRIERQGAGYVGRHGPDFLKTTDPWFRGIDLIAAHDGGVYLADWSDIGECHEIDGVHRSSGRIFKITYGAPARPAIADVAALDDEKLMVLQWQKNEWLVRQSGQILQQRAATGRPMEKIHETLRAKFCDDADPVHKLHALWRLHVTGGASEEWLFSQLDARDENVRAWVVRLLGDQGALSAEAVRAFTSLASEEKSGLVLLYLASALQRMAPGESLDLAERLAAKSEFATDPALPLMIWYGLEPTVSDHPARAIKLASSTPMLTVVRSISRRLTENLAADAEPINQLVVTAAKASSADRGRSILAGMADALRGQRKAPMPSEWTSAEKSFADSTDQELQQLAQELSVVFGDGRALDDLMRVAQSGSADPAIRRDALRVLTEARAEGLSALLQKIVDDRDVGADAVRSLAYCDDATIPKFLLDRFNKLKPPAREAAIVTLSSRPAWAKPLLETIASGGISRNQAPGFQVRQMASFADEAVRRQVSELWPELKEISGVKKERIERMKKSLSGENLKQADLANGRQRFVQACATCHTLFGQGGKLAPDLTGAQRSNLDYLLENIIDPSATVTAGYRMSTIALADGRVLNGFVSDQAGPTLTIQTPTERLIISRADVEEIHKTELSLMPEGLLEVLPEKETRDLIGYLMSPLQVPLPANRAQVWPNGR
ncbi:MAG TPA: PVC-type heme-binding CxxCH protein, partial [Pirellulales bacterium]